MRQVVLDTETTGLEPSQGHRIIEIGGVELVNRRLTGKRFHHYLQPDREIDAGAIEVHGITAEFLVGKPRFSDIAGEFLAFIAGAELIIHNAPFDVSFINHELAGLARLGPDYGQVGDHCAVLDTLALARQLHPGQRNNLDALCKRYNVDNSQRDLHGALLDAEILADVYLAMTGGQVMLSLEGRAEQRNKEAATARRREGTRPPLKIIAASEQDNALHEAYLARIDKNSGGKCVWLRINPSFSDPPSPSGRGRG